jgi:hypothetical protein
VKRRRSVLLQYRVAKQIRFRSQDGVLVPFIRLFGQDEHGYDLGKLPIKRIIVGPHPDRDRRQKAVQMLLQQHKVDAEVTVSKIPYRGR